MMKSRDELALPLGGGGCISKAPPGMLRALLRRGAAWGEWVDAGHLSREVCGTLAMTIDALTPMIPDPGTFGRIAVQHCLNDLYAVFAEPFASLVVVVASESQTSAIGKALEASLEELRIEKIECLGGHTLRGTEILLGLACVGLSKRTEIRPTAINAGDKLILTKPLGVGVLTSSIAEPGAPAASTYALRQAAESMLASNRRASEVLRHFALPDSTDIAGSGLIGHLYNLILKMRANVALDLNSVPTLPDALELIGSGYPFCSIKQNEAELQDVISHGGDPRARLCLDAQTSGGLLCIVPEHEVEEALSQLSDTPTGRWTSVIGEVTYAESSDPRIELRG